ncbi:hypothetical protein GCM10009846_01860 [Agrococcus versicolor]|uniref:Uncharacterized protein n=2 Tax=Agrococcus versicolor TaxID=501482 RepID=A0ABP5MC54_9MICO
MRHGSRRWLEVVVPFGAASASWVLLAVINRMSTFTSTFVGSSAQWLLTMLCMGGVIAAGIALGRLWSGTTRFRAAARASALALAISAASLVLFAQTYSQSESDASGYVGLAAIAALAIAIPAAILAAVGTHAVELPEHDRRRGPD